MAERQHAEYVLKPGERVPFVAYTPNLGLSEFRFCLRYQDGKLAEVLVHHLQGGERWRLPVRGATWFLANAWTHQGLSQCWAWRHFWCPEHDCPAFDLYVPREAEWFEVAHGSEIYFGRTVAQRHADA